jgi:CheY-like chemotaxis protein
MTDKNRILLVDDEPGATEFISGVLERQGFEVVIEESGEEALKILEGDNDFNLILLDYLMVGLDGIETLEMIKKQPHTSHLKVVMMSGLSDEEDIEKALVLGAVGYILKPIMPGKLAKKIKELLAL